jgi:glycosyltransferase involved in cell wall biosynthesis
MKDSILEAGMNFPISVIIPTYQRAGLIAETLESVLAQTHPANEVIVIDDGSTDDTEQVCRQFGGRIKYVKTKNCGYQVARNTGVSLSSSPWLVFFDSDDLMEPDQLERIAKLVVSCPKVCLVFSDFTFFGENIEGLWKTRSMFEMAPNGFWDIAKLRVGDEAWTVDNPLVLAANVLDVRDYDPFWGPTTSVSREYYDRIGGYTAGWDGIPASEGEFMFRGLTGGAAQIGLITRPTLRSRKHGGNIRGGGLQQVIGEVVVYSYIFSHYYHLQPVLCNKALGKAYCLCVDAMNFAFRTGQLEYVRALSRVIPKDRKFLSVKLLIKIAVSFLPAGPGRILNSILVRRRIADSLPISSRLNAKFYETVDVLSELPR